MKISSSIGNFFFRWRDTAGSALFVIMFALCIFFTGGLLGPGGDIITTVLGLIVIAFGLTIRIITIGYEYIKRGGLNKNIYAETLVTEGVYACIRNPMYLGNILIITGIVLSSNYIHFYILLPLAYFMYFSIIVAEENHLTQKYSREYSRYCQEVPRLLPKKLSDWKRSIAGVDFDWRRVLRKEKNTLAIVSLAFVVINIIKLVTMYHYDWLYPPIVALCVGQVLLFVAYIIVYRLTATGRLNYKKQ